MYSAFNTLTQQYNIQAPWESIAWKHTITQDIQATVGVQHGNTHSHKRIYKPCGVQHKHTRIYKLCGSPAWKHTIIQDIQATVGVQHGNTHSHKRIYRLCRREYSHRPRLGPDFGGTGQG